MAKRASMAALTVVGLVLLVVGLWFTIHLGSSGSATFRTTTHGGVVVLEPTVLNRVNQPITITATAAPGTRLWIGAASPSDARAVVGAAERTEVTGAHVSTWKLRTSHEGAGPAPDLVSADVWRHGGTATGTVRLHVDQADAPESVVVGSADATPVEVHSITLTVQNRTWFFQSMLTTLVGLLAAIAGGVGLWQAVRHRPEPEPAESDREVEEVRA